MANQTLMSWDIFLQGYHRRMQFADDLKWLRKFSRQNDWQMPAIALDNTLVWEDRVIMVTDCNLNIIHATENIYSMSGYRPGEIVGKTPNIFQGEKTTPEEKNAIKVAVDGQKPFETVITNYKKDGTEYKCHIEAYPVFNKRGVCVHFIALENAA